MRLLLTLRFQPTTHFIASPLGPQSPALGFPCLNLTSQNLNRSGKQFAGKTQTQRCWQRAAHTKISKPGWVGGGAGRKAHSQARSLGSKRARYMCLRRVRWVQYDPPWQLPANVAAPGIHLHPTTSGPDSGHLAAAAATAAIAGLTAPSCAPPSAGGGARRLPPCGAARRP